MAKIISGRVKKTPQSGITSDRYEFLCLEQAEPDLGDPLIGPSSVTAKPYTGDFSNLYFVSSDVSGNRYWAKQTNIISGGVLIPGSITVRDEGVVVGAVNQINDINFIGSGVTITSPASWVGAGSSSLDIQISVADVVASGNFGNIQFKDSDGFLAGSNQFIYDPTNSRVGIRSESPKAALDVNGDVNISGFVTVANLRSNGVIITSDLTSSSSTFDTVIVNDTLTTDTLDVSAISIGSSFGDPGQYVRTTGTGVEWGSVEDLIGAQGFQWVQGSQGRQGAQGAQGFQGIESTVPGPQGEQGFQGVQGSQGVQGAKGVQGAQGRQGAPGEVGNLGAQGFQGVQGAQGRQGAQGAQGEQGFQGEQGEQG